MIKVYKTKKKFFTIGILFLSILFIYILLTQIITQAKYNSMLKHYGFDNLTVEEIVNCLDSKEFQKPNLSASITGSELILKDDNQTLEIKIEDKFYLALAPYINKTHPCTNHNLITCKGELINEVFDIKIISDKEEVIFNDTVESMNNGFVGIWLPKNISGNLIVDYQEMQAETFISTNADSNTCITTPLKLND